MRTHFAIIVLVAASVPACGGAREEPASTASGSRSGEADLAPVVSGEEARRLVANGAVLLDVRSGVEYVVRHLDGAINIPVDELESRFDELDRDTPVVVYCMSGHRSANAGRILRSKGLTEVYDLGSIVSY